MALALFFLNTFHVPKININYNNGQPPRYLCWIFFFFINDNFALTSIKQKLVYYYLQKYHYFISSPNSFSQ